MGSLMERFILLSVIPLIVLFLLAKGCELWFWATEHIDDHLASGEPQQGVQMARQGHRYQFRGFDVIALETGKRVKVLIYCKDKPWRDYLVTAHADDLSPMPMVYYQGQTPK